MMQVQLEPTTQWALLRRDVYSQSKYTGMVQATKDIFREEGWPVLITYKNRLCLHFIRRMWIHVPYFIIGRV